MTMRNIHKAGSAAHLAVGPNAETVGIHLDWNDSIVVSTEEFAKEVMALGIPGLTYEPPLPTEPGLYIRKRDEDILENGPWTFRLSSNGEWHHLNGNKKYTEGEMRSKLPLVRLIVKED